MKKFLTALLIVAGLLTVTIVAAAIQTFNGTGRYVMSDFETESIARQRAVQRAKEDAQDKAGVYLTSFSQSVNARLTADEISAVTNNIIDVSDVQLDSKVADADGEPVIIWTATIKATIDPDGIFDFMERDDKQKVTIVQQNTQLRDAIQKNDKLTADLKEQYKHATTQTERDRIRQQMNDADRDFLANEKLDEGNRLYYAKDYNGAVKCYNEALQLKPNYVEAYNNRGAAYYFFKQYERAIQDYDKALKFKQHEFMYNNRGCAYGDLKQYERAIQDFDKAIQLNPKYAQAYNNRGVAYRHMNKYERAIQDFDKAIQLNPKYAQAYNNRGIAYAMLENFNQTIADATKAIELDPNYVKAYQLRGLCYQAIGETEKAQADFAKAKALGYDG